MYSVHVRYEAKITWTTRMLNSTCSSVLSGQHVFDDCQQRKHAANQPGAYCRFNMLPAWFTVGQTVRTVHGMTQSVNNNHGCGLS